MTVASASRDTSAVMSLDDCFSTRRNDLVKVAFLISGTKELAEDALHDAYVAISRRLLGGAPIDDMYAYSYTVVANKARRQSRAGRSRIPLGSESHPADPFASADSRSVIASALRRLSKRQRTAVVLRYYSAFEYPEIAKVLRCRPATARSLVHRGLTIMRREMGDHGSV